MPGLLVLLSAAAVAAFGALGATSKTPALSPLVLKKGEPWLLTIRIVLAPGSPVNKSTFEVAMKASLAGEKVNVQSFVWLPSQEKNLDCQLAVTPLVDFPVELGKAISVGGVTAAVIRADKVPGVV